MNPTRCRSPSLINLPSEIIINILSRLPIRTIISSKCVCKQLLDLLSTPEFVASHLALSTPGLVIHQFGRNGDLCQIFEFEDEFELQHHNLHYNPVIKFNPSKSTGFSGPNLWIRGSVNGLLCVQDCSSKPCSALYICNLITHEYIALPGFEGIVEGVFESRDFSEYGFGVSKISGQYKVVRNVRRHPCDHQAGPRSGIPNYECMVYTVGTRSWRKIQPGASFGYSHISFNLFLNGNLHGFVRDRRDSSDMSISCFDLEAESFKPFPPPPPSLYSLAHGTLGILDECLCFVDNSSPVGDIIVIWVMKEYGVEDSWTKQFVIAEPPDITGVYYGSVYPIKAFKDGDILLSYYINALLYFSNKTKTCRKLDLVVHDERDWIEAIPHISSFLSLKSFDCENAILF